MATDCTDSFSARRSEEEFCVYGPIAEATARWRHDDNLVLSGEQVLRKTCSELLDRPMDEAEATRQSATERRDTEVALTMDQLFQHLSDVVPASLHDRCAHILANAACVNNAGTPPDSQVVQRATAYRLERERVQAATNQMDIVARIRDALAGSETV